MVTTPTCCALLRDRGPGSHSKAVGGRSRARQGGNHTALRNHQLTIQRCRIGNRPGKNPSETPPSAVAYAGRAWEGVSTGFASSDVSGSVMWGQGAQLITRQVPHPWSTEKASGYCPMAKKTKRGGRMSQTTGGKDALAPMRAWRRRHRWFGVTTLPWGNSLTVRFIGVPIHVSPWHVWRYVWRHEKRVGVFRRREGTTLFRWGGWVLGFEIGDRGGSPDERPALTNFFARWL